MRGPLYTVLDSPRQTPYKRLSLLKGVVCESHPAGRRARRGAGGQRGRLETFGRRGRLGQGPSTLVLGGREWVKKIVDIAAGKDQSVKKNEKIQKLMGRARTELALWAVGEVPAGEGQLPMGGEIKSVVLSADFQEGFKGELSG